MLATLLDDQSASMLLNQGHFSLHGKEVSVARLSTLAHTAFLYWLPFWIPNDLVEEALESLLGDCVTSTYVRMSQPGYQDCYTTQRKITSAVSLDGLPYFLPIEFERVTHRACLFVPGRQPICFQCGQVGHMRTQCHGVKPSVVQDPVVVQDHQSVPSNAISLVPQATSVDSSFDIVGDGLSTPALREKLSVDSPSPSQEFQVRIQKNNKWTSLSSDGKTLLGAAHLRCPKCLWLLR